MNLTALRALVLKDLHVQLTDRRTLIMTILLPIAFASFFGMLFGGEKGEAEVSAVSLLWVDEDQSEISRRIGGRLGHDPALRIEDVSAATARERIGEGKAQAAVVLRRGFADAARSAIAGQGEKPVLEWWRDPSLSTVIQLVRGRLTGHFVQVIEQQFFARSGDLQRSDELLQWLEQRGDLPEDQRAAVKAMRESVAKYGGSLGGASTEPAASALPYRLEEMAVTSAGDTEYNGYSHAFAGNGVQFVLFGAIESGVAILTERHRGLWRRLRAAPISRGTLLLARVISGAILSLLALMVLYLFGWAVFGVRIEGSALGFAAICLAYALTASTFGLMLATLGKTPTAARAPAIFAVLIMAMLGGSMVPSFLFPPWMQRLTVAVPARWALDGLEAVTWRGHGAAAVLCPCAALAGFSAAFAAVALARFRWDVD